MKLSRNLRKILLVGSAVLMFASVSAGTGSLTANAKQLYRPRVARRYRRRSIRRYHPSIARRYHRHATRRCRWHLSRHYLKRTPRRFCHHYRSLKRHRGPVHPFRNEQYNGYQRWLKAVHPYSLKGLSPKVKAFAIHPVTFHGTRYRSGLALAKSTHDSVKNVYQIVHAKNVKFAI